MAEGPLLELRGITKRFPGVLANDNVSFDLRAGEVHALLGENGAGKSTLMNILYGLYTPDEGEIFLHGQPIDLGSTRAAIEHGIGMVHQHFMLIPVMTVAENIVLATEPRYAGVLMDYDAARRRVRELSERYGLLVDPDARIDRTSVGQQQRVEILKALYRGAEILILDEPTAVLTPQEAKELFEIIRSLTGQGKSIIFISHKLNEVLEVADRVTTLRRGVVVDTIDAEGATEEGLARMMVGREVLLRVDKKPSQPEGALLQVEHLSVVDDRGLEMVRDVSFDVRAGEILGLAGVDANGQSELIDAIAGLRHVSAGRIVVDGRDMTNADAKETLDAGIGHIPEDRHRRGLVLPFSLTENLALHAYRHEPNSRRGLLNPRAMTARARKLLREFDVRGGNPATPAFALSGGNQQKVVLAKWLCRSPRVMILDNPTRGTDAGAKEEVYRLIRRLTASGTAIMLITDELLELIGLSNRIVIMRSGRVTAMLEAPSGMKPSEGQLVALMLGA
jgi:general nucleoside transport system ATP-binding protein